MGLCLRPNRYALALATGSALGADVFALHECDKPGLRRAEHTRSAREVLGCGPFEAADLVRSVEISTRMSATRSPVWSSWPPNGSPRMLRNGTRGGVRQHRARRALAAAHES